MLSGSAPATTTSSPVGAAAAQRLELLDGLGERVLLTREPRDETTPECEPARLHPAQGPDHLAPRHLERLPAPQLPGDHAPAQPAAGAPPTRPVPRCPGVSTPSSTTGTPRTSGPGSSDHRPSPMPVPTGARRRRQPARRPAHRPGPPAVAGREQRAHGREGVGGDQAAGDQVPEPFVDLGREPTGQRRQLRAEAGAAHPQGGEHVGRRTELGLGRDRPGPHGAQHRLEVVAHRRRRAEWPARACRCARSARPAG